MPTTKYQQGGFKNKEEYECFSKEWQEVTSYIRSMLPLTEKQVQNYRDYKLRRELSEQARRGI